MLQSKNHSNALTYLKVGYGPSQWQAAQTSLPDIKSDCVWWAQGVINTFLFI